jgi:hypothetical protein
MPGPSPANPDRAVIRRIVAEEAKAHRVDESMVLGFARDRRATAAREKAILRIAEETGCSALGLARVWGMSQGAAKKWMNRARASVYDTNTRTRLIWAHGYDRALEIFAGRDEETNADIAKWRSLGGER